ncbi:DUF4233 domain-containing protein [Streptomonospora nanhaiensis]|uniref:DUF4233 domain-containing protein n=1 Tax=Streptomonospora nanhaiensis TaxID=1323731 RepID=UPI0015CD68F6|nr:DUF4233 domain-containing protein [Streptomonospora nanhaiensis]MBV2363489.1 DUF4233 domain-containing protein [Streptomonospora nanhaiensis]MBX9389700.1 DUF4233 domain-containing protein [Streptomonospora nanhaiensis]
MRRLCAVVLAIEVVVIGLAVPVAVQIVQIPPAVAGAVWGGLAAAALVLAALQRFRWAYYAGWALQAAFVATGFLVPGLALMGVVFFGLWVWAVVLGRRTDAMQAQRERAAAEGGA